MAEKVYMRGSKFRVAIDIYCWILNFRAKFLGKKAREFPKNALDSGLGVMADEGGPINPMDRVLRDLSTGYDRHARAR